MACTQSKENLGNTIYKGDSIHDVFNCQFRAERDLKPWIGPCQGWLEVVRKKEYSFLVLPDTVINIDSSW